MARLRAWWAPAPLDRDLAAELQAHLEMLADDHVRAGMSPVEARRIARLRLGPVSSLAERHRAIRGLPIMETIQRDARRAWRSILRHPTESIPIIAALALGIGVSAALFSVLDSALWHPIPFRDAGRLVQILSRIRGDGSEFLLSSATDAQIAAWRRQIDLFDWVDAYGPASVISRAHDQSTVIRAAVVTPDLFGHLGAAPMLGRLFTGQDGQAGSDHVVLVNYEFWTNTLGRELNIVGHRILLDRGEYTIAGVMPPTFRFPDARVQLWLPYDVTSPHPVGPADRQANVSQSVVPTLVPLAHLAAFSFDETATRVEARGESVNASAGTAPRTGAALTRFALDPAADARRVLLLVGGGALLLLFIVCVNVAALMLACDLARSAETALRSALGASRPAMVRERLTKHLLLGLLGTGVGTAVAYGLLHVGVRLLPTALIDASLNPVRLDYRVLAFAVGSGLASALLAGLPSSFATSWAPAAALRRETRTSASSPWSTRVRTGLVGAQVSLSLVLLLGAGLMAGTVVRLYHADRGFDSDGLIEVRVGFPRAVYPDIRTQQPFLEQARHTLSRLPGVGAVAIGRIPPDSVEVLFGPVEPVGGPVITNPKGSLASLFGVSPGYFSAMRIPILNGRTFTDDDPDDAVLVSARFARALWQSTAVAGRQLRAGGVLHRIVGVVGDVRHVSGVPGQVRPQVYYRSGRAYEGGLAVGITGLSILSAQRHLVLRVAGPSAVSPATIVQTLSRIDPAVVVSYETANALISDEIARSRVVFFMMAGFAVVALAICVTGLYGLISYGVEQRRREIGIRIALGERPATVGSRVMGRAFVLTAISSAAGLAAAAGLMTLLRAELYGLSPWDPPTLAGVGTLLVAVATIGAAIPARRAMRMAPSVLLRGD